MGNEDIQQQKLERDLARIKAKEFRMRSAARLEAVTGYLLEKAEEVGMLRERIRITSIIDQWISGTTTEDIIEELVQLKIEILD